MEVLLECGVAIVRTVDRFRSHDVGLLLGGIEVGYQISRRGKQWEDGGLRVR